MANMNEMMSNMMSQMMETIMTAVMQSMAQTMAQSMASMLPTVEEPHAKKQETPKPTKEEFLNLDFSSTSKKSLKGLDFEIVSSTVCKYNMAVPSDVWTINHIAIAQKYGARWSKKAGGYKFESPVAMQNFLQSYQIKTELDDTDRHNIKVYRQERAKAKAEYYAKEAQG